MKNLIHPTNYRTVVFEDLNDGTKIITKSTIDSDQVVKWTDGNEYPLVKVHISSSSHPYYTGTEKLVDIEGRVDKFEARRRAAVKGIKAKTTRIKKTTEAKKIGAK
jgi:large subunit ribosomal protein L31